MLGIDLALVRDDDEEEFDAAGGQPVALPLQRRDPGRDLRLAQELQPGILVDLAVEIGIEPVVPPGDHALSRGQAEGEAEAIGRRDQSGAQTEAIGEIGIELATQRAPGAEGGGKARPDHEIAHLVAGRRLADAQDMERRRRQQEKRKERHQQQVAASVPRGRRRGARHRCHGKTRGWGGSLTRRCTSS